MNKADYTNIVPVEDVSVTDPFWSSYMELVRTKMIPYQWEALNDRIPGAEASHCIRNFRIAAGLEDGPFSGFSFQDTDAAKWIEAAAFSLIWHPDEVLEQTIDETIDLIVSAQQEDGYLDTYYIINGLENRWTDLVNCHELYCAGHMLEAAVAYFHATGKRKLIPNDALLDIGVYDENGKLFSYPFFIKNNSVEGKIKLKTKPQRIVVDPYLKNIDTFYKDNEKEIN